MSKSKRSKEGVEDHPCTGSYVGKEKHEELKKEFLATMPKKVK